MLMDDSKIYDDSQMLAALDAESANSPMVFEEDVSDRKNFRQSLVLERRHNTLVTSVTPRERRKICSDGDSWGTVEEGDSV